ncbi:monocarboxylate transporter 10-like isoform X1 [Centruroides vittatus]|uniref:monocarboxylate transporter 10-like isoform X1 n=1 Tax=Centruroides vittatus TaxID=120091 RepID=UPI00350EA11A
MVTAVDEVQPLKPTNGTDTREVGDGSPRERAERNHPTKKYRSKSVISTDPQSPYYTSMGPGKPMDVEERLCKSPSVPCLLGYDQCSMGQRSLQDYRKQDSRESQKNNNGDNKQKANGELPGVHLSPDDPKVATIRQHYYPEGGWGWVICTCAILIHCLTTGLHFTYGFLILEARRKFGNEIGIVEAVSLGAMSTSVTLFLSPVIIAVCRRKSTRLLAVLGGLVTTLGYLFTSFASQFHQLYFSYGIVVGCGVSMVRDTSTIMVGQYFKRKRELVEIIVFAGMGIGMALMPIFVTRTINSIGWRLGLQAVTGLVFVTFILGIFYRPASLYHPQRRAILHLKGLQKRSKAKDKSSNKERPPFFDFGVLKSRTIQILMCGTCFAAFGINVPIFLLIYQGEREGIDNQSLLVLQAFIGLAVILGSASFGFVVVKNSVQCMIARQYLCQAASFMVGVSLLAFTALEEYNGYVLFVWIYGLFYGGYHYSLKMFTFEKVRARNFARAWGFVQWCQALPNVIGIPLTGYLNEKYGYKTGYYLSSALTLLGSITLFLIDVHKWKVQQRKMSIFTDNDRRCSDSCYSHPQSRRSSYQDSMNGSNAQLKRFNQRSFTFSNYGDIKKPELTCISEEVVMDNILDELDCITSCNKEEKFLMLSEYENNLNKTQEALERRTKPMKKVSVVTPLEQCPNCQRQIANQEECKDTVLVSSVRRGPRAVCSVDVIEEVTTSL